MLTATLILGYITFCLNAEAKSIPLSANHRQLERLIHDSPQQPNPACLAMKCSMEMLKCGISKDCVSSLMCMTGCNLSDIVCTTKCFFKHADQAFSDLTKCGLREKCLPDIIEADNVCPVDPRDMSATVPSSIESFDAAELAKGVALTVPFGADRAFDCFDCQSLSVAKVSTDEVHVRWTAKIGGASRQPEAVYAIHSLNNATHPSTRMWTKYQMYGTDFEEHYFVLDRTEDFVLYFSCGFGVGGGYTGAQVYAKATAAPMSAAVRRQFQRALDKASGGGVKLPALTDFCQPQTTGGKCDAAWSPLMRQF